MARPSVQRRFNRFKILRERGLVQGGPGATTAELPDIRYERDGPPDPRKSPLMLVLEDLYGKPIEELIYEDKIAELAKRFHVDQTTISQWRRRLKTPA